MGRWTSGSSIAGAWAMPNVQRAQRQKLVRSAPDAIVVAGLSDLRAYGHLWGSAFICCLVGGAGLSLGEPARNVLAPCAPIQAVIS